MGKDTCGGRIDHQVFWRIRVGALHLLVAGAAAFGAACGSDRQAADTAGEAAVPAQGYVLTEFGIVLPGGGPLDCPGGFNRSTREVYAESLTGPAREAFEQDPESYLEQSVPLRFENPDDDPCVNPAAFDDPGMLVIERSLVMKRFEPDGEISMRQMPAQGCPGADAPLGAGTERTIDNQYWRVVGCTRGYQPGMHDPGMGAREGTKTILVEIRGLTPGSEGDVEVGIYSSHDPVPGGPGGTLLRDASLEITDNTRFHNAVQGRVEGGVLITDPFDLRLEHSGQLFNSEYYLRDARLRMELHPDGHASGYVAGYWDLEWLAHAAIRFEDHRRPYGSVVANVMGYTCPGKYHALQRLADGHPDPVSGQCTSISTLFRFSAIPAFILPPTHGASGND